MKIINAIIRNSDDRYGDKEVACLLEDDSEQVAFAFFSDELKFKAEEFVGMTINEAQDLKQTRDIAYLRS